MGSYNIIGYILQRKAITFQHVIMSKKSKNGKIILPPSPKY